MLNNKDEIYLFIIWNRARYMENEILSDLRENFEILQIINIKWKEENFAANLTRFYGTKLPRGSHKEKEVGTGEFLLVLVKDCSPLYVARRTNSGDMDVNVNVFDSKEMYRRWTNGHKIHSSNDREETEHDLYLLTGIHLEEALQLYANGKEIAGYKDPL